MPIDFSHTEVGRGDTIVLLHGFCETSEIWNDFIPPLSSQYRVISLDLPGFGYSDSLNNTSLENVAAELHHFLGEIHVDQAHLIGHSLGGYVSLALAEAFPDAVRSISLVHSTAFADSDEKKQSRDNTVSFVKKYGVSTFLNAFIPMLFHPERREELQSQIEKLRRISHATTESSLIDYTLAMRDRKERTDVLKSGKHPIHFVGGAHDALVPLEKSIEHQSLIRSGKFTLLENSGHMGMFEEPQVLLKHLSNFIREV
jgi:pimeloyl-ACP methyl ester carboxylesterase